MTLEELALVEAVSVPSNVITAADLTNKSNRTLLFGYTTERDTWHVYLHQSIIYACCYRYDGQPLVCSTYSNEAFIPTKRLYPTRCDFEFCCVLKRLGTDLPFTNFNVEEVSQILDNGYYGKTLYGHSTQAGQVTKESMHA